jgi:hypothetical protein
MRIQCDPILLLIIKLRYYVLQYAPMFKVTQYSIQSSNLDIAS